MAKLTLPSGKTISFSNGLTPEQVSSIVEAASATPQTVADGKGDRERSWGETAQDMALSGLQGVSSGVQSLMGTVGDAQQMTGNVASWGAGKLGFSPETQANVGAIAGRLPTFGMRMPTTADINSVVEPVTGHYSPETTAGRWTESVGEMVPAAVAGPGSLARKTAMAVVPGLATAAVGDMTDQNPYAKMAAGIATGVLTAGRGNAGTKELLKNAPGYNEVEAAANAAYAKLRNAGVRYDANAVDQSINDVAQLRINPQLSPDAAGLRDTFSQHLGKGMDFQDLDEMEQLATGILRDHNAKPADKFFTGTILKKIKDIRQSGAIATNGSVPANEVNPLIKEAKDLARRRIIARDINKMKDKSEWYLSGPESGLRNQFKNYGSKNYQNLTPSEDAAFRSVVNREGAMNVTHQLGSRFAQPVMAAAGFGFGGVGGAIAAVVGSQVARKFMEVVTKNGVEKAIKTVLAGRSAQEQAAVKDILSKGEAVSRGLLGADATVQQNAPAPWFLQDANGKTYPMPSAGLLGVPR